jgi:hypothetical protein
VVFDPGHLRDDDSGIEYISYFTSTGNVESGQHTTAGVYMRRFEPFKLSLDKNSERKRLFLTKKGYLCLGPEGGQVRDRIMLVKGSYVPYIFSKRGQKIESVDAPLVQEGRALSRGPSEAKRQGHGRKPVDATVNTQLETSEMRWRLIGEAYVHGTMHSAALSVQTQLVETIHII